MKKLLCACLLALSSICTAQYKMPEPENKIPKDKEYTHLLVYKEIYRGMRQSGDVMYSYGEWVLKAEVFYSLEELLKRLNNGRENVYSPIFGANTYKTVSIQESDIIAIYDLKNAEKLKIKLITEDKVKKKHIEVEEEKWTEKHYEIKNN